MEKKETVGIEKKLVNKFIASGERFALEVPVKTGIVDFITVSFDYRSPKNKIPTITCCEIKTSLSDFKSKNGHNLVGDYNYYVLTKNVWDTIKETIRYPKEGYIVYDKGKLFYKSHSPENFDNPSLEEKYKIMDSMLMRWESGTMFKFLKEQWIVLRNE